MNFTTLLTHPQPPPKKKRFEVLIPSASQGGLYGSNHFKIRSWIRLQSSVTGVLEKGNIWTQGHIMGSSTKKHREEPPEDGDRLIGCCLQPRNLSATRQWKRQGERAVPHQHLDLHLASRTLRKHVSVFLGHRFVVLCHSSPRKRTFCKQTSRIDGWT